MAGDANYGDVVLLLHCDGTNGSTTFTDTSPTPKTVTVAGNTQISTTQSQFGGASAYFDGTGDYLQVATDTSLGLGTGDFTVEIWVFPTSNVGNETLIDFRTSDTGIPLLIGKSSAGAVRCYDGTTVRTGGTMTLSTWNHLAWCRVGSVNNIYLNGTSVITFTNAFNAGSTRPLTIGSNVLTSAENYQGYIDEIRITKGVARYTSDFSGAVPSVAFPDYAGQVSGIVRDSSNALCARTVRAYNRSTGALVASTTSNGTTGAYTLNCAAAGEVSVIALDDVAGTTENDLILRTTPA